MRIAFKEEWRSVANILTLTRTCYLFTNYILPTPYFVNITSRLKLVVVKVKHVKVVGPARTTPSIVS